MCIRDRSITASIIQGSAIGPASYVVNAADLHTSSNGNVIRKYADDTYLIIPSSSVQTRAAELQNVEQWALTNNLKLNRTKTNEIISPAAAARASPYNRLLRHFYQESSE